MRPRRPLTRAGLARAGDRGILHYAAGHNFILVSTDADFQGLLRQVPGANVVILRRCDYPTNVAADVLRRNAIRIADLPRSGGRCSFSINNLPGEDGAG